MIDRLTGSLKSFSVNEGKDVKPLNIFNVKQKQYMVISLVMNACFMKHGQKLDIQLLKKLSEYRTRTLTGLL